MIKSDLIEAIEPVIDAFNKLGIQYYIGGSVASSAYGFARATMDVDMVSNLNHVNIKPLIDMLEDKYYISDTMIAEAIENKTSFNLIHLETMF